MINRGKIVSAFEAKSSAFAMFERSFQSNSAIYQIKLAELSSFNYQQLNEHLSKYSAPGAFPSEEFEKYRNLKVNFSENWTNHENAREWAYEKLFGKTTFAVDGAQIMPSKHFSTPVAAVQVGWFENPHTPAGDFIKDTLFEVLTPNDLLMGTGIEKQLSEQMVNLRRFRLEIETICNYMKTRSKQFHAYPPVVLLDSSIVISFADRWHQDQRKLFIEPMIELLDTAEDTGTPIVGYVDTTYACDITVMLRNCFGIDTKPTPVHDAYLFKDLLWGERSIFFTCARSGLLDAFGKHRRGVGFLYLKANQDLPVRLDIPVWIYKQGLLDYVVEVVLSEVIIGTGYPYALATATDIATISSEDRAVFYRIFQRFMENQQLPFHFLNRKS
ncbi:MAG: DNA double-strand break repair nuclease NurA [Blastocatellia bacterium]|nr:DNA double-strand break repair nuclease NurA [Blastocatellia bacterium]